MRERASLFHLFMKDMEVILGCECVCEVVVKSEAPPT